MLEDEYGNFSWGRLAFSLTALVLLVVTVWFLVDRFDQWATGRRLIDDSALAEQQAGRLNEAHVVYEGHRLQFADHWSIGVESQLTAAEKNLFPGTGNVFLELAAANDAYARGERSVAKAHADAAEIPLHEADGVVNKILGPPDHPEQALFTVLADEALQADPKIAEAEACIPVSETAVIAYSTSPNYLLGVNELNRARDLLAQARFANVTKVERGIIDKPQAFVFASDALIACRNSPVLAAPPPPTAEPRHNDPVVIDTGSDDSGGWDSGSDSGSWDSGGSDSGSWDSGGSDSGSWDSGGWDSGSDSGSWDSGGDSWDSGGSDSGSW
jgi:hypothetical protein